MIRGMPFLLIGIEPLTLPRGVQYGDLAGDKDFSAFSAPPGQTIAAPETLRDIGAAAGASVTIDGGKALPPIRSSGGTPPGLLVVDIGMAQALLDRPGQLSRLILQQTPGVLIRRSRERRWFSREILARIPAFARNGGI